MAKKKEKAPEGREGTEEMYQYEEKTSFDGKKVKVLGPTFKKGQPDKAENWRQKLASREDKLAYLKTGERYWFSTEWFGSEKRKTPA